MERERSAGIVDAGMREAVILLAAFVSFVMSLGFVTLVWRVSWAIRGWVETEKQRAVTEDKIVAALNGFIASQSETNTRLSTTIRVLAQEVQDIREEMGYERRTETQA